MNLMERPSVVFEPESDDVRRVAEETIEATIVAVERELEILSAYRNLPGRSLAVHGIANDVANTLARIIEYERIDGSSDAARGWRRRCEASIARCLSLAISRK